MLKVQSSEEALGQQRTQQDIKKEVSIENQRQLMFQSRCQNSLKISKGSLKTGVFRCVTRYPQHQ